ncbi:MAG: LemA family protein [Armatimonadota bacterium]
MWIFTAIIVLLVIWVAVTYNGFVSLRNRARNAWADIDVQLKRRHDLVPNLVSTVQGYASHEKSTLEDIARLRARAVGLRSVEDLEGTEAELAGAIKSLFAVAESYPDLRADKNFRDLQSQLAEIENNIQYARRYYNAVVRDMNTRREVFPPNIIASIFNFEKLPYFQVGDDERNPVDTSFNQGQQP